MDIFRKIMKSHAENMKGVTQYFYYLPAFLVVAVFYLWFASWGTMSFNESGGGYQGLAEGFMQGKVSMTVEPNPRLLQLSDPYEPTLTNGIRAHDLSLFQGKYYFYFGPLPVLIGYIPYKILFGTFPDQRFVTVIFCILSFFLMTLLFILIVKPQAKSDIVYANFLILMAGFGNLMPFFLVRSEMYEVAISVGTFTSALFLLLLYLESINRMKSTPSLFFLTAASLACGLGVASRPNLIVLIIPLLVGYWVLCEKKNRLKWGIIVLTPLAICGVLLASYNYVRFGSIFEFGQRYQLAGMNIHKFYDLKLGLDYKLKHLLCSLYMYILNPPIFSSHFPFFSIEVRIPQGVPVAGAVEPSVGILFGMPIVLLSVLGFIKKYYNVEIQGKGFFQSLRTDPDRFILFIAILAFILILGLVSSIPMLGSTARYMVDFSGFLILVASTIWYRLRPKKILFLIVFFYTLSFGFFTGMQGYYNTFNKHNPELVKKFERFFSRKT